MPFVRRASLTALAVYAGLSASRAPAQQTEPPRPPQFDFSSVFFANYQYGGVDTLAAANRFELERAYLTFRMPVGERVGVRVTADVFQQSTGWTYRIKYAYLQYDLLRASNASYGMGAFVRFGVLHTVVIEHVETFWPRWISRAATELSGFFSSADVGAAAQLSLPRQLGEVYSTVTNGRGYTSPELDRFKDYAVRVSLTPLARSRGIARTLALTGWGYLGSDTSRFLRGGPGQVGPVGSSLRRDRWGVFVGLRDPRVIVGAEYASRIDGSESGQNTPASPRLVDDVTGRLLSGFAIVQPLALLDTAAAPLGVVLRVDRFEPNTAAAGSTRFVIAGLTWPLSRRATVALDYQERLPKSGAAGRPVKTYFAHLVASF